MGTREKIEAAAALEKIKPGAAFERAEAVQDANNDQRGLVGAFESISEGGRRLMLNLAAKLRVLFKKFKKGQQRPHA